MEIPAMVRCPHIREIITMIAAARICWDEQKCMRVGDGMAEDGDMRIQVWRYEASRSRCKERAR